MVRRSLVPLPSGRQRIPTNRTHFIFRSYHPGERHQTDEFVSLCVCFSDFKLAQRITLRTGTVATFFTVLDSTLTALVNVKEVGGEVNFWLALTVGTISIS